MHPLVPYFPPLEVDVPLPGGARVPLAGFGCLAAVGFLVGAVAAMRRAASCGLDPHPIRAMLPWLIGAGLVGGHLGYGLWYQPAAYFAEPIRWLELWHGLSSVGGVLAGGVAAWIFLRRSGLPLLPYVDSLAWGLPFGWTFGRLGCFVAHDHPGPPTRFWLGVYGICPNQPPDVACHDLGLYEAFGSAAIAGLFLLLARRRRKDGFFVAGLGLLYAPMRFALDLFRPEITDARWGTGLTPAQWAMVAVFVAAVAVLPGRLDPVRT